MYQIKYQTVNSIVKCYLRTGLVFVNKRGGDRRSKLTLEVKERLLTYVDSECTKTLREIVNWVKNTLDIDVSTSTIDRALREFHYT
jgi:transposase